MILFNCQGQYCMVMVFYYFYMQNWILYMQILYIWDRLDLLPIVLVITLSL